MRPFPPSRPSFLVSQYKSSPHPVLTKSCRMLPTALHRAASMSLVSCALRSLGNCSRAVDRKSSTSMGVVPSSSRERPTATSMS